MPEGVSVGRRGVKEYRAGEALNLKAAPDAGRVTLHCTVCGRSAVYLNRPDRPPPERAAP